MQIVVNDEYVRSRVRIGNWVNYGSLALLGAGFVLSLLANTYGTIAIFGAYAAMIAALLLLSFSRTYTRRFGPRFRQDQLLVPSLRGLDNQYTLFNYAAPDLPDHILVGPSGLYVLIPRFQGGRIRFDGHKWSRGNIVGGLLRTVAEGGIGNPLADVRRALGQMADYLRKHGSEELIQGLEARPIIVFTNPQAHLEARNSPVPVVQGREVRAIFRRAKATLPAEKVEGVKQVLASEVGK